jgi:hypothetical protein
MLMNTSYSYGSPPSNPNDGDMYYDLGTGKHNMYSNGQWFELKVSLSKNLERKEKIKAILK